MTLWILFAVVALPIILLSLKGLFVVATEGGKPPLPHTRGGFYTSTEIILEDGNIKAWDVDLGEFLNDVEDDPEAASMLGTPKKFDLDAEKSSNE